MPAGLSSTATALLIGSEGQWVQRHLRCRSGSWQPLPAYIANPSYPTHWREELIRVDHNLTQNQRLTFRYIHDTWGTIKQGPLCGAVPKALITPIPISVGPTTSFVAKLTSNFTPSLLNEFVASYTDDHIFLSNVSTHVNLPSGGIDLVPLFANGLGNKIPAFAVGNTAGTDYGPAVLASTPVISPGKTLILPTPTATSSPRSSAITPCFSAPTSWPPRKISSPLWTFRANFPFPTAHRTPPAIRSPICSPDRLAGYFQNANNLYYYDRYKILEPFFQDDWRVTKKLTLNLGLRWSVFGRYQEKHDQEFGFSTGCLQGQALLPAFYPVRSNVSRARLHNS